MQLTINELTTLATLLSKCKNDKDLKSPLTIVNTIKLTKSVHAAIKKYFDEQKEIFERFEVKEEKENGMPMYNWDSKPEDVKEKINSVLAELNSSKYVVKNLKNISEDDFVIFTRGLNQSEVVFLYDYLVKDE